MVSVTKRVCKLQWSKGHSERHLAAREQGSVHRAMQRIQTGSPGKGTRRDEYQADRSLLYLWGNGCKDDFCYCMTPSCV
ncbi:hypothetical protein CesoFtcFv8_027454 [Champsocephalus esox]|uniref:Uncharacterized protein n=1 Tax=Champsocephalus esox TaxID=159716 RepID=A0AAN7YC79_9TELE|nr:hypothetical protein CesoFtcFv8_027454 [Champsocephalus esox]